MALINCPECQKQISDTAKTCPNCGYIITSTENVTLQKNSTQLGEKQRNIPAGLPYILIGIVAIIVGIPMIPIVIGVFAIIGGFAIMGIGISKVSWSHEGKCPYCNTTIRVAANATNFKCPSCKKISVRKDNILETVN